MRSGVAGEFREELYLVFQLRVGRNYVFIFRKRETASPVFYFVFFFFSKIKVEVHFHKKQYHRFVSHITLLGEADFSSAHGRTVRFAPGS